MIRVTYYRGNHRLTVKGHAGSGESGHDLVCASVSMLTYTLAEFVSHLAGAGKLRAKCVKLTPGDARISCRVSPDHDAAVALVFDSICAGFGLLAREHSEFICYEIMMH